ncbi:MAG: hypothetical protein J0I18_20920 [Actinobacteria bacterium]|nr:hypothetical protein [Actinomycetota bacterium]
MDKNRLWLIASVLVMALVLVGGWFVGVQPQLAGIADSEAQTAAVEATNEQNARVVAQLKKDSENLPALKAKLAELAASVPQGSDIPPFVDQLNALYSSSGVVCVDQAFADGGYETTFGRWSYVAPGSETVFRGEASALLNELHAAAFEARNGSVTRSS